MYPIKVAIALVLFAAFLVAIEVIAIKRKICGQNMPYDLADE